MSDDKTKRHPQDGKKIDINDPKEVANWCLIYGVTAKQLKDCVDKVGVMSEDVSVCLGK